MAHNIPQKQNGKFKNGIRHSQLHLWDAWSYYEGGVIHLYCLAVPRFVDDGVKLDTSDRNSYPFHMRHFTSDDDGETWKDEGCLLEPRLGEHLHDSRTIWSGSIELLRDGNKLVAYTGIYDLDKDRTFLQNISLAISSDGAVVDKVSDKPLSCPVRDRDFITETGYYLDSLRSLGHKDGEEGGPIMAWRDPFVFIDSKGGIHIFWAAKIGPFRSALAHALLDKEDEEYRIAKLYPPVTLPDGDKFTQLELPKIYFDNERGIYYLIVSTCNRMYEGQSDNEVDKSLRLYRSDSHDGPWEPHFESGSQILKDELLFGLTVLRTDFVNNRFLCIAPYTDAASEEDRLTFCKSFFLELNINEVENPLSKASLLK